MKKLFEYLPLHFIVGVILGILLQFYTHFWKFGFLKLLFLISFLLFFFTIVRAKIIRTLIAIVLFFIVGILTVYNANDKNFKSYFEYHYHPLSTSILKVNKVLKPSAYHHKYEAEVIQVNTKKTKGVILLNVLKDSTIAPLKVDELLLTKSNFKPILKPLNPNQFDYQFYLAKQGIHQQLFLNSATYKTLGIRNYSVKGWADFCRNKVKESLQKYHFNDDVFAVINALLLGQRQELSKELTSSYAKAGAIHILAVSGLHIGIILWMLTWFLKPLERLRRGKLLKTIVIVLLLWCFACIAGLSASVVRAVTMFTFVSVGLAIQNKREIVFSLLSSMFFLLIFNPMFLFDVGFQLSYLAVFGIIFIQPQLIEIYKPRFWIAKKVWEIFTVSVAAQIAVLPLSLYYFHQFPGLFILSNLVIIPILGSVLIGGIALIILSLFDILPQIVAGFYADIIHLLNHFISWIAKQEAFLFQDISFSGMKMLVSYILIIFTYRFFVRLTSQRFVYVLISILSFQGLWILEKYQKRKKREFLVFHKSKNTFIGNRRGDEFTLYHDIDTTLLSKTNPAIPYTIAENLTVNYKSKIPDIFKFEDQSILIVDSLGVYAIKNVEQPIVILQQSPKINLERLIRTIQPKLIICDGSNYKSYVKRWAIIAEKQKTPFFNTGKNGAFNYKF